MNHSPNSSSMLAAIPDSEAGPPPTHRPASSYVQTSPGVSYIPYSRTETRHEPNPPRIPTMLPQLSAIAPTPFYLHIDQYGDPVSYVPYSAAEVEEEKGYEADTSTNSLEQSRTNMNITLQKDMPRTANGGYGDLGLLSSMAQGWTPYPNSNLDAESPGLKRRGGVRRRPTLAVETGTSRRPPGQRPEVIDATTERPSRQALLQGLLRPASGRISRREPWSAIQARDAPPNAGRLTFHEHFATPSHYPEAQELFAIDTSVGKFVNPFTAGAPPQTPINRATPESPPSPWTRTNYYGSIERWIFEIRDGKQVSLVPQVSSSSNHTHYADDVTPVSPLSHYGQFVDDGIPVSPLLGEGERRSSGGFRHEEGQLRTLASVIDRPLSAPESSSYEAFSSSSLDAQLNELLFEDAAYEFFSRIDVEGLVYRNCCFCRPYIEKRLTEKIDRRHWFDRRYFCPACERERSQRWAAGWRKKQKKRGANNRVSGHRYKPLPEHLNALRSPCPGGDDTREYHLLRRETGQVKGARVTNDSTGCFLLDNEGNRLPRFTEVWNEPEDAEAPAIEKEKIRCRLFSRIKKHFREDESD